MMLSQLSVIVYLLLMCLSSDGEYCTISQYQYLPEFEVSKYNAYCKSSEQNTSLTNSDCHYSCSSRTKLKITSRLVNSTLGILEVMFTPLTLCNFSGYKFTLFVDETVTEDACSSVVYNELRKHRHSSKVIFVKTCEPGGMRTSCNENVTLLFYHVFSGCYLLDVELMIGSITMQGNGMLLQYITTDYKKNFEVGVQPNFTAWYSKNSASSVDELHLSIAYSVSYAPQLLYMWLYKIGFGEGALPKKVGHIYFNTSGLTVESKIECNATGLHNGDSCRYLSDGVLACVLHNMSPGHYTATLEFVDDRCGSQSIWADDGIDPCIWDLTFWANETDNNNEPVVNNRSNETIGVSKHDSHNKIVFILAPILVFFIALLLTLLAFVAYRRRFAQYPVFIPTYNRELKPLCIKEQPTVLLLYARDCGKFMDVMEELRSILKSSLGCMVFDYWDPMHYENVAQGPTDWVLRLISNKSVRIVLVATQCSQLLEAALLTDRKVEYRKPDAFDKLFVFALRHLTQTTILDSYNRIFVVRLDKSTQNNNSGLTYFNPLTVYSLPTHLDKLMLGLHRVDATEYAVSVSVLPEVKHFSSSVKSFQNFVHVNPHYLHSLLELADPDIV